MPKAEPSPLERQITRVTRRLFIRTFLSCLAWCASAALLLSALWFEAAALWLPGLSNSLVLGGAGGIVAIGLLLALVLGVLRAPSKVTAALLLDERFQLRERVTTSLTLTPEQQASPAAQALLEDVNHRVGKLDVGSRFPVATSWTAALAPLGAACLAALAFFYHPAPLIARIDPRGGQPDTPTNAAEIERKLEMLKRQAREHQAPDKPKSEELKKLEAELERIANQPHETKEQLRQRVAELTALEEQMKDREKSLGEKSAAMKEQLKQMDRASQAQDLEKGPAKDLQKALSQGKFDQAKEEMDRLAKKLKNNELNDKEKEQLAKQLKDLQKKLERLSRKQDEEDRLKKLNREGKLDGDTLKRELDRLKQDQDKLKDLQDLANKLGQVQENLKKGDGKGASQGLKEAGDQLKQMGMQDQDLADLQDQLKRLEDAKDTC